MLLKSWARPPVYLFGRSALGSSGRSTDGVPTNGRP